MATLTVAGAVCQGREMHKRKGQQERIQRVPVVCIQGGRTGPEASEASVVLLSCFRKGMRSTRSDLRICIY